MKRCNEAGTPEAKREWDNTNISWWPCSFRPLYDKLSETLSKRHVVEMGWTTFHPLAQQQRVHDWDATEMPTWLHVLAMARTKLRGVVLHIHRTFSLISTWKNNHPLNQSILRLKFFKFESWNLSYRFLSIWQNKINIYVLDFVHPGCCGFILTRDDDDVNAWVDDELIDFSFSDYLDVLSR